MSNIRLMMYDELMSVGSTLFMKPFTETKGLRYTPNIEGANPLLPSLFEVKHYRNRTYRTR